MVRAQAVANFTITGWELFWFLLRPCIVGVSQVATIHMSNKEEFDFERELTNVLDRLYAAALRMVKNPADAEDLVSDAVTKALTNRDSLQDPGSFRGWLFRILTNTFISSYRKQKSSPELKPSGTQFDSEDQFWLFDRLHQPLLLFAGSNPEQEFLNNVLREDLNRALDKLKDEYRIVVLLADVEGFSYPEIAEILEIPVGTVRSRLARARSRLQNSLWQQAIDMGFIKDPAERLRSDAP